MSTIYNTFYLNESQINKLQTWVAEQDSKYLADQKERAVKILAECTDSGIKQVRWAKEVILSDHPVSGAATPGYYTYTFHPLTIGTKVIVSHEVTKESIDLSDYEAW